MAPGETPSPEIVAAAAKVGDLSPAAAWAALAAVLAELVLLAWLFEGTHLYERVMLPKPAPVLAERGREVLAHLGPGSFADDAYAFEWDRAYFTYVSRHDPSPDRWGRLARAPLLPVSFFYRQSPRKLMAVHRDGMVRRDDPPLNVPGMREVVLDSRGRHLIEFAVAESREKRAGSHCVLLRISELMFVEVVRRYLATLGPEKTGWLAGLRDPTVGRALGLLHQKPAHPWTLETLAREAVLSRSALAERFTHFVGQPPMQYLTRWRLQMAARLLADGAAKVSSVAFEVGYDSEAAFSRAFKKAVGMAPATWRDRRTDAAARS